MNKTLNLALNILTAIALTTTVCASEKNPKGEGLFKEKCASCHPDGGNK